MSSPSETLPDTPLRQALRAVWATDRLRLIHACKTAAAVALGLGITMRLQLGNPGTTMASIVILMMHQQAGMTVARGIYRLLGMCSGCIVALLMVHFFAQSFAVFYLLLGCWTACCVWGAQFHRNYQSYGFVLAGYAASIVAVPAWSNPYGIVDSVIFTMSDVLIAIVSASLVNAVVFPQQVRAALFAAGQQHCAHLIQAVRTVFIDNQSVAAGDATHIALATEHVGIEALRSAAVIEDPELREHIRTLNTITAEFLDVTSSLHGVRQVKAWGQTEGGGSADAIQQLAANVARMLPAVEKGEVMSLDAITAVEASLDKCLASYPAEPGISTRIYETFAEVSRTALTDLSHYLRIFGLSRTLESTGEAKTQYLPLDAASTSMANRWAAGIAAVRALIVVLVMASVWYISGWNGGGAAVTGATIAAALFSTFPNPARASGQLFIGAVSGGLVAAAFAFFVEPHLYGFPMLAAAIAPVIMVGNYVGSFPSNGPIGVGFNIQFVYVANITNPGTFDPVGLLDFAIAFTTGIGVAVAAYKILAPTDGSLLTRLYLRQVRRVAASGACRDSVDAMSLLRFESGIRDFVTQTGTTPSLAHQRQWGFTLLDVGVSVLKVRLRSMQHDHMPNDWPRFLAPWREAIALVLERVTISTHARALHTTTEALEYLDQYAPSHPDLRAQLHVVRLTLLDSGSVLHPGPDERPA